MGLTPNVVAGAPILSTWGNEIRDRTAQRFATVAERSSQWPTPPRGALSTIDADLGNLHVYTGTQWVRADWGSSWGLIAIVTPTPGTASTGAAVAIAGASLSFTPIINRRVKYTIQGHTYVSPVGPTAIATITMTDAGTTAIGAPSRWDTGILPYPNAAMAINLVGHEVFAAATPVVRRLWITAVAGGNAGFFTDVATGRSSIFMAEDVGPAGPPT